MPVGSGGSRIWLMVNEDQRLPQMIKQVEKLEDVLAVRRHGADHAVFRTGWRSSFRLIDGLSQGVQQHFRRLAPETASRPLKMKNGTPEMPIWRAPLPPRQHGPGVGVALQPFQRFLRIRRLAAAMSASTRDRR